MIPKRVCVLFSFVIKKLIANNYHLIINYNYKLKFICLKLNKINDTENRVCVLFSFVIKKLIANIYHLIINYNYKLKFICLKRHSSCTA